MDPILKFLADEFPELAFSWSGLGINAYAGHRDGSVCYITVSNDVSIFTPPISYFKRLASKSRDNVFFTPGVQPFELRYSVDLTVPNSLALLKELVHKIVEEDKVTYSEWQMHGGMVDL